MIYFTFQNVAARDLNIEKCFTMYSFMNYANIGQNLRELSLVCKVFPWDVVIIRKIYSTSVSESLIDSE